jgi:hypothetical protein
VLLGLAFGTVLEDPEPYRVSGGYRIQPRGCDEWFELGDDVMVPALALIDRPRTVFEAKATKFYGPHEVVAKADQLIGARLIETKTTLSTFDFEKYADSYQWRFMVDVFQPAYVTYHVFCLDEATNGVISLRSVESFNVFPYPALHLDCSDLLTSFVAYVERRGLVGYLQHKAAA